MVLLNNLSNLVKRNNTLITKVFSGEITLSSAGVLDHECQLCISELVSRLEGIVTAYHECDLHQVTKGINAALSDLNAFFHHRAPWLVHKGQAEKKAKQTCLVVSNFVRELVWLLTPITPELCQRITAELGHLPSTFLSKSEFTLQDIKAKSANSHWKRV